MILHPVEFYLVGAIVLFRQSYGKIADHIPIGQGEAEIQGGKVLQRNGTAAHMVGAVKGICPGNQVVHSALHPRSQGEEEH